MKKIAIKSSIFAFFLTLLVDLIIFVVALDVPSRIMHFYSIDVIDYSLEVADLEDFVPPEPEPYFLSYLKRGFVICLLVFLYFQPTFFAYINKVRARRRILLANIFLGWTIVGWFVCFFWAFSLNRDSRPDRDSDRDERSQKAEQE